MADAERVSNVTSAMKNMERNRLRKTPTPEDNEYPCKVFYLVVEPICVKNGHFFLPDSDSQFVASVQRVMIQNGARSEKIFRRPQSIT